MNNIPDYGGLIRVFSLVKFMRREGWSETYRALIDTGAHTSVIPKYIWRSSEHKIMGAYEVHGLVPNEECKMDVKIGTLRVVLLDENGNQTEEEITAFFAERDDIPLILGFKDLLENYELNIMPKDETGFLSKL
ncbi:MAG: hypothetical protein V3U20_06635 [Thermoplasmata archaeon]